MKLAAAVLLPVVAWGQIQVYTVPGPGIEIPVRNSL